MESEKLPLYSLPVMDTEQNRLFFEHIGFTGSELPLGYCLTDGALRILLTEQNRLPTGLIYPAANLEEIYARLSSKGFFTQKITENEELAAISITDPTGISLIYMPSEVLNSLPETAEVLPSGCGKFYELSIKTNNFQETVSFWLQAGFSIIMGKPEDEKFVTLSDEMCTIGLYNPKVCPHLFNNPALTFFELDMAEKIKQLQVAGVVFRQELPNAEGLVEDAILESPEGQHLFMFKGWE